MGLFSFFCFFYFILLYFHFDNWTFNKIFNLTINILATQIFQEWLYFNKVLTSSILFFGYLAYTLPKNNFWNCKFK